MKIGAARLSSLSLSLLAFVAFLLAFSGCGGGSNSSNSTSTSATASTEAEPSSQFAISKADKAIVTFGKEGSAAERSAASAALQENLTARAAGDWAGQCATLSLKAMQNLQQLRAKNPVGKCPGKLKKLGEPLSVTKEGRANTLTGEITALRVKGNKGYALYHGNDGKDHAMSLEREDGSWKIGSITTVLLR